MTAITPREEEGVRTVRRPASAAPVGPIPEGEIHVSRRRHAADAVMPDRHAGIRPQTILIIVIVLAGVWFAVRGADPTVVVQVLGGIGASRLAAEGRLQGARRAVHATGRR
ncbi:hypothetical protein [Streptomyces xanthochromogenes]|uniref:hypothetical protein n=1 Tax=Streptomyces xanthochromogenes TaxID=67384 RepID=UPI003326D84C